MQKPVRAVLTAMDQPLGRTVGNALEVAESIACLRGEGPPDVMEVTYALGEQMLLLAKVAANRAAARRMLEASIRSGAALAKFREIVSAQGGDVRAIDNPALLPRTRLREPLPSAKGGYVRTVDAMGVARAALRLGAGRARAEDRVDPAVGIGDLVKVGERIAPGGTLAVIHANDEASLGDARRMLKEAISTGTRPPKSKALIEELIS
jgi:pyrimidine-nucleoside phosphorylase